jgi:uncharacterized protein (TIGR03545 family)
MRSKAIYILIGLLVITGLVFAFWGNTIIARGLENTLQAITGAKVEIEGFRLNLFSMAVKMERLQIANPADTWRNIIAAQNISFKLAPGPLYEGKIVIDEIAVADLVFNEKRRTDGKLERARVRKPEKKKESILTRAIATMPILNPETLAGNLDLKKITASYQFKTDLSVARIKAEFAAYKEKWDNNLEELNGLKNEIQGLEEKINRLKKPNNLVEINEQLQLLEEIRVAVEKIQTGLNSTNEQFQKDRQALTGMINGLKEEAEADYQALLALAKLPDLGRINYGEALLGKTIFNAASFVLDAAGYIRELLPARVDKPPKVKPTRDGQDIAFPGRKTYPRFLVKKIAISGRGTPDSAMDGFYASGVVTGITSEPPVYGLPLTAALFAQTPNQTSLKLDGEFNHVTPEYQDTVELALKGLSLPGLDLSGNEYLPSRILAGTAEIDATVKILPDRIQLKALVTASRIKMDFSGKPEPGDLIGEIVRKTLAGIDQVMLDCQLEEINDRLEMKISSNLDQMITNRLDATIGEKVTGFTRELRAEVEARLRQEEKSLVVLKNSYEQAVATQLKELQERVDLEKQKLEAKKEELEAMKKELEAKKKELESEVQKKIDAEEEKLKKKIQKGLEGLKDMM